MTTIALSGRVDRQAIAQELAEARARTLLLLAPLSDEDLRIQHDPLMSPLLWDLGHIAHFEELWLTRNLDGPIEFVEMPGLYNPFEHPRKERGKLALPGLAHSIEVMEDIRQRVLARLAAADFDSSTPLLQDGYVYRMVLQHEYQHNETMLQTLQLKQGAPYHARAALSDSLPLASELIRPGAMAYFPGGDVEIGSDDRSAAYDNERTRHTVALYPFWIDVHPVTNGEFAEFIATGGYSRREFWSEAGWRWLEESGAAAPKYWNRVGRCVERPFDGPHRPGGPAPPRVSRVLLRSGGVRAGMRESGCLRSSSGKQRHPGTRRTQQAQLPWGEAPAGRELANVDQLSFGTAPIGVIRQTFRPSGAAG